VLIIQVHKRFPFGVFDFITAAIYGKCFVPDARMRKTVAALDRIMRPQIIIETTWFYGGGGHLDCLLLVYFIKKILSQFFFILFKKYIKKYKKLKKPQKKLQGGSKFI